MTGSAGGGGEAGGGIGGSVGGRDALSLLASWRVGAHGRLKLGLHARSLPLMAHSAPTASAAPAVLLLLLLRRRLPALLPALLLRCRCCRCVCVL